MQGHLRRGNRLRPSSAIRVTSPSSDLRMNAIRTGLDRAMLDRGGWRNLWVEGDHYAAGEPLPGVAVGSGVRGCAAEVASLQMLCTARRDHPAASPSRLHKELP